MLLRRFGIAIALVVSELVTHTSAAEPVLLKFKPAKGDALRYKYTQKMKQSQSLSIMGMTIKQNNSIDQDVLWSRTVEDVSADGHSTFVVKAVQRKLEAEFANMGKYKFDSTTTDRDTSSALGSSLTPVFERLTGSEYRVVLSPRGQVTEVKGYAEVLGDLLKDNPFAGQFAVGDNKAAAFTEQDGFLELSDKPVSPGDKWEVAHEQELSMLGKIKTRTTYTYEGPGQVGVHKTARISESAEVSIDLALDQGGAKVSGTLTSSKAGGTIHFDPVRGRVVSIERAVTMGGQLTVDAGGMTIPLDNQQEETTTYTLLEQPQ